LLTGYSRAYRTDTPKHPAGPSAPDRRRTCPPRTALSSGDWGATVVLWRSRTSPSETSVPDPPNCHPRSTADSGQGRPAPDSVPVVGARRRRHPEHPADRRCQWCWHQFRTDAAHLQETSGFQRTPWGHWWRDRQCQRCGHWAAGFLQHRPAPSPRPAPHWLPAWRSLGAGRSWSDVGSGPGLFRTVSTPRGSGST